MVLSLITDAPWFVRNDTQHTDLNMTDVATASDIRCPKLRIIMRKLANPLLQAAAQNIPPPKISRRLKKKRRRHRTHA